MGLEDTSHLCLAAHSWCCWKLVGIGISGIPRAKGKEVCLSEGQMPVELQDGVRKCWVLIPLLGIQPEENIIRKDACTPMFIAALFIQYNRQDMEAT